MTRNRKTDAALLEREYIFDTGNPPISYTELADRHGIARSGVADKGRIGHWYERRIEFREQLGMKVVAALGDKWVEHEVNVREKMMLVGLKYLDKYAEALDKGEITITTRDMLGQAAMIRTLLGDIAASQRGEETTIDPDSKPLDAEYYRKALTVLDRQLGDGTDTEPGYAGEAETAGIEGTGED